MPRCHSLRALIGLCLPLFSIACPLGSLAYGQAGLRKSLERLDRNENGEIDPEEVTPLARPYLERISKAKRMSLGRSNSIEEWQEAARVYHALQNGVSGRNVTPKRAGGVMSFGPEEDQPLVPEFGLSEVKYPYIQDDLDQADRTLRRSDRNKDGYIDRAEARRADWTHRDPFEEDYNNDDRLSRLELAQRYARRRLLSGTAGELIKKAVRTGNGIRSSDRRDDSRQDDWRSRRRGGMETYLARTLLSRFDSNRNGRLSEVEAGSMGIPFGRMDVNRDGELDRDELQAFMSELQDEAGDISEGLPSWFYERDKNRDNQVAMAEFAEEWTEESLREFNELDTNQDGLLTINEAIQAKSLVGGNYTNRNAEILAPRKTVISEIVVDDEFIISDLNLQLSITHTYTSQLDGFLIGPDGQRIELFTNVGGSDDHFTRTIFDDQSGTPITKARPPFEGSFSPEALQKRQPSLSHFNGQSMKGVWQLVISGSRSERFGMLHSWGLTVKPE